MTEPEVHSKILEIQDETKRIAETFNEFAAQTDASIRDLLVSVGIFDSIHELEKEKFAARERALTEINALNEKLKELGIVLKYVAPEN